MTGRPLAMFYGVFRLATCFSLLILMRMSATPLTMECPHDQTELTPAQSESFDAQVCASCGGLFLKIDESKTSPFSHSQLKPGQRSRIPKAVSDLSRSPASGQPMIVFKYRGVEIDYCCTSHSVWLDAGEWEKIMQKSGEGGPRQKKKPDRSLGEAILDGLGTGFSVNLDSFLALFFDDLC